MRSYIKLFMLKAGLLSMARTAEMGQLQGRELSAALAEHKLSSK
jgi:hypothetical protein